MPLLSRQNHRVMAEELDEVSVVEVYEIASQIGSECEKLIDLYGSNCVENLIKKCIVALEMLEAFAEKNERETSLIQELNDRIAKLESEKAEKAETKRKFEKEIEAVEENWRCETRELLSVISRLQKENQRLSDDNRNSSSFELSPSHSTGSGCGASDERILQKLEDEVVKQKNEIREKSNELNEKTSAIEQYKSDLDVQKHQNVEIRKRLKMLQMQIRNLCEERADFLATLQDQNREIITLKRRIGLKDADTSETGDVERDESTIPRFTVAELKEILNERNELKNRINDLEEELASLRPVPSKPMIEQPSKPPQPEPVYEEDLPVQGPLPEEWYRTDDHWKKRPESGIKKFFRKIFPDTDEGSSFSKRSLTSLTKIALSASGPHTDIPI